jgi:hypothetical protein
MAADPEPGKNSEQLDRQIALAEPYPTSVWARLSRVFKKLSCVVLANMRLSRIRLHNNITEPQRISMPRHGPLVLALIFGHATSAMAQDAPYTLIIKDHMFQPTEIEIPADKKIALIVKNEDPTPEEFESVELRREKVVPGGEQITVYIGPLKPGRYEFFGDFNPTTARGHIVAK